MGASWGIIRGGFEGLGDPDLEAPHETPVTRRLNSSQMNTAMEVERNSISISATQMEILRQREISKSTFTVNQEGPAHPVPIKQNLSRLQDIKYVIGLGNPCPFVNSPLDNPHLHLSRADSPQHSVSTVEPNLEKINNI